MLAELCSGGIGLSNYEGVGEIISPTILSS